jgi:hypothetical protein
MDGGSVRMRRQRRRSFKTVGVVGLFRFLEKRSLTIVLVSGVDGGGEKRRLVKEAD